MERINNGRGPLRIVRLATTITRAKKTALGHGASNTYDYPHRSAQARRANLMRWSNGLAEWTDGDTAYLSIAFTWRLRDAYQRAVFYRDQGFKVRAGGPAVFVRKHFMEDVAEIGGSIPDAVAKHNPLATFASRGCPVGCWFCIVPKMEGRAFTLLPEFPVRPILCDNNLSALTIEYQQYIIDRYIGYGVQLLDANSGFEPATFDAGTYERWKKINRGPWRYAYDESKEGDDVYRVSQILRNEPSKKKRVYVLVGNEPFEPCYRRIVQTIEWGCEPHVQPYMKLNALEKVPNVRFDWTEQKLRDLARWTNTWLWRKLPFQDYARGHGHKKPVQAESLFA